MYQRWRRAPRARALPAQSWGPMGMGSHCEYSAGPGGFSLPPIGAPPMGNSGRVLGHSASAVALSRAGNSGTAPLGFALPPLQHDMATIPRVASTSQIATGRSAVSTPVAAAMVERSFTLEKLALSGDLGALGGRSAKRHPSTVPKRPTPVPMTTAAPHVEADEVSTAVSAPAPQEPLPMESVPSDGSSPPQKAEQLPTGGSIGDYDFIKCPHCHRTFNPEAHEIHARVCERVFRERRTVFNSMVHRLPVDAAAGNDFPNLGRPGTSGAGRPLPQGVEEASTDVRRRGGTCIEGAHLGSAGKIKSHWRQRSDDFRRAMREAQRLSRHRRRHTGLGKRPYHPHDVPQDKHHRHMDTKRHRPPALRPHH